MFPARDTSHEVHLRSTNPLRLVPELVPKEQAKGERDWYIIGDEGRSIPITVEEDVPLGAEDDDDAPHQSPPSGVGHKPAMPWEVFWVYALNLQSTPEANAGYADTEPIKHSSNRAHVAEPAENSARGPGDGQVRE